MENAPFGVTKCTHYYSYAMRNCGCRYDLHTKHMLPTPRTCQLPLFASSVQNAVHSYESISLVTTKKV